MAWSRRSQKYSGEVKLSQVELDRRGLAVRAAQDAFSTTQEALAFLNNDNTELGGRPLDVATASDEGLALVEQAIAAASRPPAQMASASPCKGMDATQ